MSAHPKKPITRLTAIPASLGAVLVVGAVAFGATGLRTPEKPAPSAAETGVGPAVAGARVAGTELDLGATEPKVKPTKSPKPSREPKPSAEAKPSDDAAPSSEAKPTIQPVETHKPKPSAAPTTKPSSPPSAVGALELKGWAKDRWAKLAWKPYGGDGFEYYKVVRSSDATVTWPTGAGDAVVGVIGNVSEPWLAHEPPCGQAWFYRVFAVRSDDGGYRVLAASNTVSVTVACVPEPTPVVTKPIALQAQAVEGGIQLAWEACEVDGFVAYKLVRSQLHADPRFPLNEGTELVTAIGDVHQTSFLDATASAGESWTYRIVAKGEGGILCQSAAVTVSGE